MDRRIQILYVFIGIHLWHQELTIKEYNSLYATALGVDPVDLGTLNSVSRVGHSVISILGGWMADRYGAKKILLLGLAIIISVAVIYSLADSWLMLIPAIPLLTIGTGFVLPYTDMLFINYGGPQNKSMIISISRTLWAIGKTTSPIVAAVIVAYFGGLTTGGINAAGIRPLYYIQVVLAILAFIGIALWLKVPKDPTPNSAEKTLGQVKKGAVLFKTSEKCSKVKDTLRDFYSCLLFET